ncbi:MAG: TIGR03032 family protein [Prolixibacteraceae bacterium]|jgi:uncharacterized protein (TIGR03032 family)|nr:TIGR03032 family protein [Prolixibacteraceae bacterium]
MNSKTLQPFACQFSPNIPELLALLKCTIVLSTYQAGKVIFLSATDDQSLIQLPRNFNKAMGIAIKKDKMAIAVQDEVIVLANSSDLAKAYPPKPNTYDALYLPRATYYTGNIDMHDLEWIDDELWGVSTRFSCLSKVNTNYSIEPIWKPSFISDLTPEDRCHLNGMAIQNAKPKYVTALGKTNTKEGWRAHKAHGGIIIDVESNEFVLSDLAMPHSPRLYNGELYCLLSANGQLIKVDTAKGAYKVVKQFDGYVRGMAKYNDYLFIGLSKIRTKSSSFGDLSIAEKSNKCAIEILHFPTMSKVGQIQYLNSVEEIYDVKVLSETTRPNVLSTTKDEFRKALVIPTKNYWAKDQPST